MDPIGTASGVMSEAEARYLDRVVEDCADLLGPGVDVDDLEIVEDAGIVLRLRYHLGTVAWTSEGQGPTVTAAHGALREQLVIDRIKVSVTAIYRAGR
jgi:hypothetical protein